ncbi:MAG TPA: LUD domain-containing protein [Rhizomicrobium sp.]|nr:LUD domain-containing protein [Rhizomicrobium sp.]
MSAREGILNAIRAQRVRSTERPSSYVPPAAPTDPVSTFSERASAVNADVRILDNASEIPAAIADLLRSRNLPAEIHVPPGAGTAAVGTLTIMRTPPGPDDAALTTAPFGIAETGTLAYPASAGNPASWHFRPAFEIAVLKASDILPNMENVIARVKVAGLPHTLNFVTGPSRTGDIEQTLELGAHGPKALAILIVKE